jgi:hypothetical protein
VSAAEESVSEAQVGEFEEQVRAELEEFNPRFEMLMTDETKQLVVTSLKEALKLRDFYSSDEESETGEDPSFGEVDKMEVG